MDTKREIRRIFVLALESDDSYEEFVKKNFNLKYHLFVTKEGEIKHLLPLEILGSAIVGLNSNSAYIVYQGGILDGKIADTRTEAQKKSILGCLWYIRNAWSPYQGSSPIEILGFKDVANSLASCDLLTKHQMNRAENPGFDVKKDYSWETKEL